MPCPPPPSVPWYILFLPLTLLALWIWDGSLWRRKRLFFHQYLWQQARHFLGTDRS
jgi:hypothetical protein